MMMIMKCAWALLFEDQGDVQPSGFLCLLPPLLAAIVSISTGNFFALSFPKKSIRPSVFLHPSVSLSACHSFAIHSSVLLCSFFLSVFSSICLFPFRHGGAPMPDFPTAAGSIQSVSFLTLKAASLPTFFHSNIYQMEHLSLSLSLCLSMSISVYLSVFLFLCLAISAPEKQCLPVRLCACL